MKITYDNLWAVVEDAPQKELLWLRDYLSFEDTSARFRTGKTKGQPIMMFNVFAKKFPSGLLPLVRRAVKDEGIPMVEDDRRDIESPASVADVSRLAWLRDYQREAVDRVILKERGILWHPTGAGKTEIAVALCKAIPVPWLFLAHRKELVINAVERYALRADATDGEAVMFDGSTPPTNARFVAATFQNLWSKYGTSATQSLLRSVGGVIVDEAHTLPAGTFWKVAMTTDQARYRIGLSGTPLARGDKRSVQAIAAVGPVIHRIKPQRLIDAGVLARPCIQMVTVQHTKPTNSTWAGVNRELIVRSQVRNDAIIASIKAAAKPCLVFVKGIEHGKALCKRVDKEVGPCAFVYGQHEVGNRLERVKDLRHGELDVLISTVIFQEGIDIPPLRSVVIATGGASAIAAVQRLGRGMRRDVNKNTFELWDVMDIGGFHNPDAARPKSYVAAHSKARAKAYAKEGHEVLVGPVGGPLLSLDDFLASQRASRKRK